MRAERPINERLVATISIGELAMLDLAASTGESVDWIDDGHGHISKVVRLTHEESVKYGGRYALFRKLGPRRSSES